MGWAIDNNLTDLHPTVPEAFKGVVPQPLFRLTTALRALHLDARKGRASTRGELAIEVLKRRGGSSTKNQSAEHAGQWIHENRVGRDEAEAVGGCETTMVTSWSDWQRAMCLIPDIGMSLYQK